MLIICTKNYSAYINDRNRFRGNVAFDYSELQIIMRSLTSSDKSALNQIKIQQIINSTFENSKSCTEIFDIIKERLESNRSTILNITKVSKFLKIITTLFEKTLDIIEILLLNGSEKFISIATNEKELIKELAFHQNIEGKQKIIKCK